MRKRKLSEKREKKKRSYMLRSKHVFGKSIIIIIIINNKNSLFQKVRGSAFDQNSEKKFQILKCQNVRSTCYKKDNKQPQSENSHSHFSQ